MKNTSSFTIISLSVLYVLAFFLFAACSKEDTPAATFQGRSKEYKLFNLSSGASLEAGTFTIAELENGNSKLTIRLNEGYRVPGAFLQSSITVTDNSGVELVYANLNGVLGASGLGETNPVVASGSNANVKYNDIITKVGYTVKVLNGSNVQAKGTIN